MHLHRHILLTFSKSRHRRCSRTCSVVSGCRQLLLVERYWKKSHCSSESAVKKRVEMISIALGLRMHELTSQCPVKRSPVINGCNLACCGDHRLIGSILSSPCTKSMNTVLMYISGTRRAVLASTVKARKCHATHPCQPRFEW